MKRTQRNLLIIMTAMMAVYLLLTRLPPNAAIGLFIVLLLLALFVVVWGRDFLIARRLGKRRQYPQAIARYQRFEKKLSTAGWQRLSVILYLGIYSFDGIAITRNNIGQCFMNAEDLDQATRWFRSALQHDPLYPVPYVNLAVIAAMRRDETTAKREMTKAVQLGFNPTGAQRILSRALAAAEESKERDGR